MLPVALALLWGLRPATPVAAAFPGANGKIVFVSNRDGNFEIYIMNANGSGQTNVSNNAASEDRPAWSPDGSKIAFERSQSGNFEIYVMNADGSDQINRSNNAARDGDPSWSPDGTKIAFASNRDGNSEIYVMNADGSGQARLTTNSAHDDEPAWSPDGTKIAFYSNRDGNDEIYVMNANGSSQINRSNNAGSDQNPAWSPDGTKIAFFSTRDGNDEIYVMNANGSSQINRSNNAGSDQNPAWSPDGTKIAFFSGRDEPNGEIYVMNANGSGATRLTTSPSFDFWPDWQPIAAATIYASPGAAGTIGNDVTVTPQDILRFNSATGVWSMFFDGSTVGVTQPLSAFARRTDGSLLLSFQANLNLGTLGTVTPWDVVRFVPSSGAFQWWIDGSDVGLTTNAEKLDALEVLPDGRVLVSTTGTLSVPKAGGGALKSQDEDLTAFTPTATGQNTSGTWALYFNGTAVPGLKAEDVTGAAVDAAGNIYLTLESGFNVGGVGGGPKDMLRLRPSGNSFTVLRIWRGPDYGFDLNLSGIELE